jgi:lysophospholipase L1-like esterase
MVDTINLGKVGITTEGAYDSSKAYEKLSCVTYNHESWVSTKDVPAGNVPADGSAYWQKMSERGEQGIQGPVGPQGNSAFDGNGVEIVNNLTQGGEAAVLSAEQGKILKGELAELSEEIIKITGVNISTNPSVVGFVTKNGTFNNTAGYWRTDYISTKGVTHIKVENVIIYSIAAEVAFFDKDKTYLSELAYVGNEITKTIYIDLSEAKYADVEYVIVSSLNQETSITLSGDGLQDEIRQEVAKVNADVQARFAVDQVSKTSIQGFIDKNGNVNGTAGYWRTDYIDLGGYDKISAKAIIYTNGYTLAFFDSSKKILPSISLIGKELTQRFEIDLSASEYSAAKYVVLSTINQSWGELTLSSSSSIHRDLMLLPANNHINMLVFGDSITHAANIVVSNNKTTTYTWETTSGSKPWVQIVKDYLAAYDVRDYAKQGASYVDQDDSLLSVSKQIEVAINDISNPNNVFPTQGNFIPDIVIFALGTNDVKPTDTYDEAISKTIYDANGDVDVDATLNNLDRSKFYQAVRYAYLRIKSVFPMAMTMSVLPIQRAGVANNLVVGELHDGIKKMAERYSIKVIDGASELGIAADLEKVSKEGILLGDGLHPNGLGRNLFARMMLNAIKCNYVNMSNMNAL